MREKNTFKNLVITTIVILTSVFSFAMFKGVSNKVTKGYDVREVDCERYFDLDNGYTSLFEIVDNLNNGYYDLEYKTWGTVTKFFNGANNNQNFYIQSSDKYGRIAGVLVFNSPIELSEGTVITISGVPLLYDNIPEFLNPNLSDITIDYTLNSSPVETLETDASFWQNGYDAYSAEFLYAQTMGARQISVSDVEIEYKSNGNATAYFADGTPVTLYFYSVKNTSAITGLIYDNNYRQANITGILHSRINNNIAKITLLLRDVSDITILGLEVEPTNELMISESNGIMSGNYLTGNYGTKYVSGFKFEYYRTINTNYGFASILPTFENNTTTAPGAFYNIDPIVGITTIELTYYTDYSYGIEPLLEYGKNGFDQSKNIQLSGTTNTISFALEDSNYFKISTREVVITLIELKISYTNESTEQTSFNYSSAGSGDYRINPYTYNGALIEGLSVSVPSNITRSGNYYIVNEYKTYTYYSYNYVTNNESLASEAAYVDPIDVAAYFTIFKTAPANYVLKNEYSSAYYYFGENTRCVSFYTRTDGYARAVPYKATDYYGNGNYVPSYYELDIALSSSYSSSNRGVGRVVAWEYGFDPAKGATLYDDSPVCVYTDDHYYTFQEYLNDGTFGKSFNAEGYYTSYVWGASQTLSLMY